MLVKEYRICMPLTVEEFQIGQLFTTAEASKNETGGGDGIEILKNEPFENENGKGQYTYKIYHLTQYVGVHGRRKGINLSVRTFRGRFCLHLGAYVPDNKALSTKTAALAATGPMTLQRTVRFLHISDTWQRRLKPFRIASQNPDYMKERFLLELCTWHKPGKPTLENVHNLDADALNRREVVNIDIAGDVERRDYKEEQDPTLFVSEKTGRGPLDRESWMDKASELMTCYKLVRVEFKWFGLQSRIEHLVHSTDERIFRMFHRQLFCWIDKWYGMTLQDIRALEESAAEELVEARQQEGLRGTVQQDDEDDE